MPNLVKQKFDTLTTFGTLTNLHSLADGNWWQSGEINDTDPINEAVLIWWHLVFNATPVAGDHLLFKLAFGDEDSTEIWDGGIGTSEAEVSTAASVAAIDAMPGPKWSHRWETDHGTTFKGHKVVPLDAPSWQLLVKAEGEALASSGNLVKYRYVTTRIEASS